MADAPKPPVKKTLRGHTGVAPKKLVIEQPKIDFTSGGKDAEIQFQSKGLEALAKTLRGLGQQFMDIAGYEMADILHEVIDDAKENYVPFLYGNLKDSGNADEYSPTIRPEIIEMACWFGAPLIGDQGNEHELAVNIHGNKFTSKTHKAGAGGFRVVDTSLYAAEQHENMEFKHTVGGPKYLERPFNKIAMTAADRIAAKVAFAIAGTYPPETP